MDKVTFLIPPSYDGLPPADRSAGCTRIIYPVPNIYELQVAALMEQMGATVDYLDFSTKRKEEFENFLSRNNSHYYFIWTVNLSIKTDVQVIDRILNHCSAVKHVFLLGPGATFFCNDLIDDERVLIIRGEPEATLQELFSRLHANEDYSDVLGITYKRNNQIVNNKPRNPLKNLDSLPFAARHLLKGRQFHNPKLKTGPYTTMITSRSCPYHCIYCVPSSLTFAKEIESKRDSGKKPIVGYRSVENVTKELELLHTQGYRAIGFMDDNFIWNQERTEALCASLSKYGFVWGCQARVDAITEPIAKLLGDSGCKYIDLGIESFDDSILKYIKKGITVDQIYTAISLLKKYHVPVKLNVLIGSSPIETKETVSHTLREVKRLDVDQVMINIVSPFPGTEFYDICKENGWIKNGEYVPTDVQRESIVDLPNLTSKEMEKLLFWSNIKYFLSPSFVFKQIKRFDSWEELVSAIKAIKVKLFG